MALDFDNSFLEVYLDKHRLDPLPPSNLKRLVDLEDRLRLIINNNSTLSNFKSILKQHGFKILDLVDRVKAQINANKGAGLAQQFMVVIGIGFEVYQLVEQMQDSLIVDGMSPAAQIQTKISFGQDLVYFVWSIADPLKNVKSFPFKQILEKKLVKWLAGLSIRAAMNFFGANRGMGPIVAEVTMHPENIYKAFP